jgi:uncharacterized protein
MMSVVSTHSHDEDLEGGPPANAAHAATALRLRRAHGHLHTVIEMLEQNRSCTDIAQQLQAVESAVKKAKRSLIQEHLEHCIEEAVGALPAEKRRPIDDFKEITKYL